MNTLHGCDENLYSHENISELKSIFIKIGNFFEIIKQISYCYFTIISYTHKFKSIRQAVASMIQKIYSPKSSIKIQ